MVVSMCVGERVCGCYDVCGHATRLVLHERGYHLARV